MAIEEGFYLETNSNNMYHIYEEGGEWKAKSRTDNVFDNVDKGFIDRGGMIRINPEQYMRMTRLNSDFIESELAHLSQEIDNVI